MPCHFARHTLLALLLLAAPLLTAAAQTRDAVTAPAPLPVVVRDSLFDVVLLTHASAEALNDSARMSAFFGTCRNATVLRADDSLAVIRSRLWDWNGTEGTDHDRLTLLVTRASQTDVGCGTRNGLRATALARGFRVTKDVAYPYGTAITSVTVHRGTRLILPDAVERIPTSRVTARGLLTIDGDMIRVSVPFDSLAPAADGRVDDMQIEITTPDSAVARRISVPWEAMQAAWEQMLYIRSGRLDSASASESRRLLTQLARPGTSADRLLEARVGLGSNLSLAGDFAAARAILGRAVIDEPCLTLSLSSPLAAREIVAAVRRPAERCHASVVRTMLQATLLPGLGQTRGIGRKVIGALVFGAVAGTLAMSQAANAEAEELFTDYLAVDGLNPLATAGLAESAYDRAESRRLDGRRLVMAGATLWAASIVEATWTELRLKRRLGRVHEFAGRARTMSSVPGTAPGRIGLALNLF